MSRKVLTEEQEAEVCKLYKEGLSSLKLAERFSVGKGAILGTLRRNDVERRPCRRYGNKPKPRLTPQEEQSLISKFEDGITMEEIHQKHGVSRRDLRDIMRRHDISTKRGSDWRRIDFTDEQEAEIVRLYEKEGLSIKDVGKRFDVGHSPIDRILEKHGVETRDRRILTDGEEKQLVEMYKSGVKVTEIVRVHGVTHGYFRNMLIRRGIPSNRPWQYDIDEHAFDVIDNEASAYWLGFIFADGCTYKNRLSIALSAKDAKHLEKIKVFLKTDRPLRFSDHEGFGKVTEQVHFYVNNDHLAQSLKSLGITKDRPDCRLATDKIPDDLVHHFIRGHMDGNGSVGKNRSRIRFIGQEDLMEWIREKLSSLTGTTSWPRIEEGQNTFVLGYSRKQDVANILSFLYDGATIYLQRKKTLADKWM